MHITVTGRGRVLAALVAVILIAAGSLSAATHNYRKDPRSQIISRLMSLEADSAGLAPENISRLSLPEPYYRDTLPFLTTSVLIFSELLPEAGMPRSLDSTVAPYRRKNTGLLPDSVTNPRWLKEARLRMQAALMLRQMLMTGPGHHIDYFAWQLPEPPQLAPITGTPVLPVMRNIPSALPSMSAAPEQPVVKRHWLHAVALGLQFSQAYVSPNWYQGGDNSLTVLANLGWNVKLNTVYHPNLLLESNLQYKLGLYSTPRDEKHKYAISEDQLQYNLTGGVKAFRRWYYSFSMQFRTQMLNNYAPDSWDRKASFLSPGDLNLGLGMTYNNTDKKRGIVFQASIAPLSYNLRTCIDSKVDPTQFNIKTGRKTSNEFGSNAELTMTWQLAPNISWKQRLFLFSDYNYFSGDWEHTFNFSINRFLSTQFYLHGRYDTSAPGGSKGWKKWMLKEILSFGFSYAFTTVPPKK